VISAKWLSNMSKKALRDPPLISTRVNVDATRDILSSSTTYSSPFRSGPIYNTLETLAEGFSAVSSCRVEDTGIQDMP
jgi:hypothetical protein